MLSGSIFHEKPRETVSIDLISPTMFLVLYVFFMYVINVSKIQFYYKLWWFFLVLVEPRLKMLLFLAWFTCTPRWVCPKIKIITLSVAVPSCYQPVRLFTSVILLVWIFTVIHSQSSSCWLSTCIVSLDKRFKPCFLSRSDIRLACHSPSCYIIWQLSCSVSHCHVTFTLTVNIKQN